MLKPFRTQAKITIKQECKASISIIIQNLTFKNLYLPYGQRRHKLLLLRDPLYHLDKIQVH
jgi:hypothetical protein